MSNREKIIGSIVMVVFCLIFYFIGGISSKNRILTNSEFIEDEYMIGTSEKDLNKDVEKTSLAIEEVNKNLKVETVEEVREDSRVENKEDKIIVVDIDGAVKKPDVYKIEENSRLIDLIKIAGGLLEEAETRGLNKAERLKDGCYYYIAKIGEDPKSHVGKDHIKGKGSSMVNINTATLEELMKLSGIGEIKAKAIMEYREALGGFKSIDELSNIQGIGEKTLDKLREFVDIK